MSEGAVQDFVKDMQEWFQELHVDQDLNIIGYSDLSNAVSLKA